MKTNDTGRLGEKIAAQYLQKNGYRILEKNTRVSHNELDIIALEGNDIVFAEVKTRSTGADLYSPYGSPASAVNRAKRSHLIAAASQYLRKHPQYGQRQPRFDVIEVYLDKDTGKILQIHHIPNAFGRH